MLGHAKTPRRGFTLIELLVVIGIIAILIALLVPAVQRVRKAAARAQGSNNLRQLAIGVHSFHDVNKALPCNGIYDNFGIPTDINSGSWLYQILPYIEHEPMFKMTVSAAGQATARTMRVEMVMCPGRLRPSPTTTPANTCGPVTDYAINCWINEPTNGTTSFANARRRLISIADGSANTILLGQSCWPMDRYTSDSSEGGSWNETFLLGGYGATGRRSFTCLRDPPTGSQDVWGSPFDGGGLFSMADAAVRLIAFGINLSPGLRPDDSLLAPNP